MQKRKIIFIPIIILMLVVLSACGSTIYVHQFNIKAAHKEWAKAIGLFSHDNLKVRRYEADNNEIELGIVYKNGMEGYEEFCEVVNAHNKFVEDNPEFFSDNTKITINNELENGMYLSFFSNVLLDDYMSELVKDNTAKLQYMYINVCDVNTEIEENDKIGIDVPIVVLANDGSNVPSGKMFAFLNEFKNAEQVVIDFSGVEYDRNAICEDIHEYLPNAEVYDVVHVTGQDYLEKCQ